MADSNVTRVCTSRFTISTTTSLRKSVPLPDLNNWNVDQKDVILEGDLKCYTESEGFLFRRVSAMAVRHIFISTDGFLFLFRQPNREMSCPEYHNYVNIYIWAMHIGTAIGVPFNMFGVYCIVYKSSPEMSKYRWYLLTHQVITSILDLTLGTLILPVLFFYPVFAGYSTGIYSLLGISTQLQDYIGFCIGGAMLGSLNAGFLYRHQCVLPYSHPRKLSRLRARSIVRIDHFFQVKQIQGETQKPPASLSHEAEVPFRHRPSPSDRRRNRKMVECHI